MTYHDAWRNRAHSLYSQFCYDHELSDSKLKKLIDLYGCAFDDEYYYYLSKDKQVIVRSPIWLAKEPQGRKWRERVNSHTKDIFQKKLEDVIK